MIIVKCQIQSIMVFNCGLGVTLAKEIPWLAFHKPAIDENDRFVSELDGAIQNHNSGVSAEEIIVD